jgi:hypothetical protein
MKGGSFLSKIGFDLERWSCGLSSDFRDHRALFDMLLFPTAKHIHSLPYSPDDEAMADLYDCFSNTGTSFFRLRL